MATLEDYLFTYIDTAFGHAILAVYLFVIMDERNWRKVKKLPALLLSPLAVGSLTILLYIVFPGPVPILLCICSQAALLGCVLWVQWAWKIGFWRALSATSMAGLFQVSISALSRFLFKNILVDNERLQFVVVLAVTWAIMLLSAALLHRLSFGRWFRLFLDEGPGQPRTALLLFILAWGMMAFYFLQMGLQPEYFALYYLLVLGMAALAAGLVLYLAQWFDAARKMEAQRDIIAQQQLYERDLEDIRREVRTFRHDYKNLLAGLSQQADEGELDTLRATLAELDAGFDRRIGEKIRVSTQIGNLLVPQIRSLLLSKLTGMGEQGIECRLEVFNPVEQAGMDVWDFVRCLGILLDNAAQAALETETPWVEIVLLAQGDTLSLWVSNPYAGTIDPDSIWTEGFSTKGKDRGLGLSSYQRILAEHPNTATSTSWAGGVFVQELKVEGRP